MGCLMSAPETRIGKHTSSEFASIVKHPWFHSFDWSGLHTRPGPLIPTGCENMDEMLEYLKFCPTSDARFPHLIDEITRNFDKFPDAEPQLNPGGKPTGRVEAMDGLDNQFVGYTYKRNRKPRLPISGQLFEEAKLKGCVGGT
jgi:hypothetical protein